MANTPASHQDHPAMDYAEHDRTFAGFVTAVKFGTIAAAAVIVLMAIFLL